MSRRPASPPASGGRTTPGDGPERFPGFDVMSQLPHWDPATAAVVESRLGPPPAPRFFSPAEEAIAAALLDLLLGQDEEPRVPVTEMIDERLAEAETDGWRYDDMPEDGQAWRDTLAYLDADAQAKYGARFAEGRAADQCALIQAVRISARATGTGCPPAGSGACGPATRATPSTRTPGPGTRSAFGGLPIRGATRTWAWGGGSHGRWPTASPADDPVREGE